MFRVGIAFLVALGCVAASVTCLVLTRHRKQSQERRTLHPLPTVKRPAAEDSVLQAGAATQQTEAADHGDIEPCIPSNLEPPASGPQTDETRETADTTAPDVKPIRPAEPSTYDGQGDFTECPPSEKHEVEPEAVPQLEDRRQESDMVGELLAEQQHDSMLKSDTGSAAAYAVEGEPPAVEQVQPTDVERDGSRLESDLDLSRQAAESRPRAESQESKPGGASAGEAVPETQEERGEMAVKGADLRNARKPTREAAPAGVQAPEGESTAGGDGKLDSVAEQILTATRAEAHQRKAGKAMRKRKPRQSSKRHRMEVKAEGDKRLLAEVPEIPETQKVVEDIERDSIRRLRRPSRYWPPSQEPLVAPQPSAEQRPARRTRQGALTLIVRLLFERSGHFRVGLLPQRETDMPEDIVLGQGDNGFTVTAVHDVWYGDVFPENLGELLSVGIAWEGWVESEVLGYWRLSGRDLYVLTTSDLRGFAQTTRLKIGRDHVILCRDSLLAEVEPVLHQAGCTGFTKLGESYGAPPGWTAIRSVMPTNVVRVENGPEILSVLQPEPELTINLQGGIYLQQSTWLSGFPPQICLSGAIGPEIKVFIDGDEAVAEDDGSFRNQGYDTVGEHRVSIPLANISRTYRISQSNEVWTPWDAYNLARIQLCGPLLLASDTTDTPRAVVVPSCNSVILGAKPGDIAWCPRIRGPKQVGCVTFHPVWALPGDAFGCDKRTTHILLLDARRLDQAQRHQFTGKKAARVLAWSAAILNSARKGLSVESSDGHAAVLWGEYKKYARSLWKMLKR